MRRYDRNMNSLSKEEIKCLHGKKVCIIGCGGLGGYIVETLARIGIHYITVVDYDVFDETNLNRQLYSSESVIGKSKVLVCKERMKDVNSKVEINAMHCKFDKYTAMEILSGHDVVVDALDSVSARMLLAEYAGQLEIPMVHGSIGGWYGQVATIFPGDITLNILYRNQVEKGSEVSLGNLPFTASSVASLQCAEVIKLLTGKGTLLRDSFIHINLLENEFDIINLN